MKILYVADLHYSLKQFDWLVEQRGQYDVILIGGDLLDMGGFLERDVQSVVVEKYFEKLSSPGKLGVISGNHDFDTIERDEHLARWLQACRDYGVYVDGDCFVEGDVRFVLLPWVNGPQSQAQAEAQLEAAESSDALLSFWCFHEPPDQYPVSWNGKRHLGSQLLVAWIARWQPDIVVGGHVHNAPFYEGGDWKARLRETWAFNPGKQIGSVPSVIEFDLSEMRCCWRSLEGVEVQDLRPG